MRVMLKSMSVIFTADLIFILTLIQSGNNDIPRFLLIIGHMGLSFLMIVYFYLYEDSHLDDKDKK